MDKTDDMIADRYRVQRCIARGSVGEVYEAIQEPLGRSVAVKVMRMDIPVGDYGLAVERFHHEAQVTANLYHPNIVTVYDYGRTHDGRPFMAMEYVRGRTLKDLLDDGPMKPERVVRLFSALLEGLAAAHQSGLVHRDLKPANIIVSQDNSGAETVKILDFGMSVFGQRLGFGPHGWIMGSLGYMSPEQARSMPVDARSDLYAVGVMLYESLTGRSPYLAETLQQWLEAHSGSGTPQFKCIGAGFRSLVRKSMAKDPDQRYASAKEMGSALRVPTREIQRSDPRIQRLQGLLASVLMGYTTVLLWTVVWSSG